MNMLCLANNRQTSSTTENDDIMWEGVHINVLKFQGYKRNKGSQYFVIQ